MFKYKSPLSRLLEGAGKPKEEETVEVGETETVQDEKPEPIADFNALRAALGGGDLTSDSDENSEDLIPEEAMPEFEEDTNDADSPHTEDEVLAPEAVDESEEPVDETEEQLDKSEEQIVTLHLNVEDAVEPVAEDTIEQVEEEALLVPVVEDIATQDEIEIEDAQSEAEVSPEPETTAEVETVAEPEPVSETLAPVAVPVPTEDRRSRVKTTFLGFERADTHVQDLIETAEPVAKTEALQQTFPVGWLVVTGGPGRGSSITLTEGLMQIGRNDDQAIQLDFGDTGISRSNHAVIAYDAEDRKCYLGHGGKANLVRLNGKPVLSTVALSNGDLIRISETSIRFTAFCDEGFDWRDAD